MAVFVKTQKGIMNIHQESFPGSGIFLTILSYVHDFKLVFKVAHPKMTQFSNKNCGLISRAHWQKIREYLNNNKISAINLICARNNKNIKKPHVFYTFIKSVTKEYQQQRVGVLTYLTAQQETEPQQRALAEPISPSLSPLLHLRMILRDCSWNYSHLFHFYTRHREFLLAWL